MSEAAWRALAEKALGGRSIEALSSLTPEGLRLAPLYERSRSGRFPAVRQTDRGRWALSQRIDHPDAEEANRLALIDLEGGADALSLVFAGDAARGFGLPPTRAAIETALEGVELDLIALRIDAGGRATEVAALLADLTASRRLGSSGLAIDLGLDPLGDLARTGIRGAALGDDGLGGDLASVRRAGWAGRIFLADGRCYHEAGAGEAEELAALIATGVAFMRRLAHAGLSLSDARAEIAFLVVVDADILLSIGKVRALRRLWARVEDACEIEPRPIRVHAETSWRMMTRRDPWVNVMRTTAAAFAAGVGGADTVAVLPHTAALGLPDDAARRLARNTQLILLDEAHLAKVDDPASGSGAFESLTDELCARAWDLFQQIEREGGMEASLLSGAVQSRIAETASRRRSAIATMAQGITGTSTFPSLENASFDLARAATAAEPSRDVLALPSVRDAAPFEALRDEADAMAAAGHRPTVFLATLGPPASHGPRAAFAVNFLAAAGIATASGRVDAYAATATPIACLCGSDATYAEHLAETAAFLRAAGARRLLLIAPAGQADVARRTAEIDVFIHDGSDAEQILRETLQCLSSGAAAKA